MKYISTRGERDLGEFSDVLLTGLAADGGLAMPVKIPEISPLQLADWKNLSYQDLAYQIMSLYISDIESPTLKALINESYQESKFHHPDITPLKQLGDEQLYLLELSNGPSLAFKDIAMQFLGQCFEYVLEQRKQNINILGATSGDTGSAAEYAMLGKSRVNVFMLSPYGRMSPFQQAQMYSLNADNIFNIAIEGVFDDCQDLVKTLNQDAQFKSDYQIGAVNSINWARILAQVVYYFKAYFALPIAIGDAVDFSVPSGNFGNIFAGLMAKKMGLPIRQLIVASNENDVLYEFFSKGCYRVRKSDEVAKTSSPSMDIGKASNFERFLYLLANGDAQQVRNWYELIDKKGFLDIKSQEDLWEKVKQLDFQAGRSTHQNRLDTIADIYHQYQRTIDPHTADGIYVAKQYQDKNIPMICLETALPAKFSETVEAAIHKKPSRPERFINIEAQPIYCEVMANHPHLLKEYIRRHLL